MKLQDQVCNLDQAKKLKELGISQDSLFSWCGDKNDTVIDRATEGHPMTVGVWIFVSQTVPVNNQQADHRDDVPSAKPFAAAFTVAELGQMLNQETYTIRYGTVLSEYANWEWVNEGHGTAFGVFPTEAEARADLLINLINEKHITAEEANKRLNT